MLSFDRSLNVVSDSPSASPAPSAPPSAPTRAELRSAIRELFDLTRSIERSMPPHHRDEVYAHCLARRQRPDLTGMMLRGDPTVISGILRELDRERSRTEARAQARLAQSAFRVRA